MAEYLVGYAASASHTIKGVRLWWITSKSGSARYDPRRLREPHRVLLKNWHGKHYEAGSCAEVCVTPMIWRWYMGCELSVQIQNESEVKSRRAYNAKTGLWQVMLSPEEKTTAFKKSNRRLTPMGPSLSDRRSGILGTSRRLSHIN